MLTVYRIPNISYTTLTSNSTCNARHFIRQISPGINVFQTKIESVGSLIILPIGHNTCLHVKYDVFGLHSSIRLSSELWNTLT